QLATFARLGPLSHLDLQFLGVDQVVAGDTKAAAGHLLDGAVAAVTVGVWLEADRVFATLARVAATADPVHGNGQRLVSFLADAAVRHGTGSKPLDDLRGRFDFSQRHGAARPAELQQTTQREQLLLLVVNQLAEFAELIAAVDARGLLQL